MIKKNPSICQCCKQIIFNRNANAKFCKPCSDYHVRIRVKVYIKNSNAQHSKKVYIKHEIGGKQ